MAESALDYEIAQEQAAALGRLGRALEAAITALSSHDNACAERSERLMAPASSGDPIREQLVQTRATRCGALSFSAKPAVSTTRG
jgi:hypothetical protein